MHRLVAFLHDESGATAIEYGLIAALISVTAIAAMTSIGTGISNDFNAIGSNLTATR